MLKNFLIVLLFLLLSFGASAKKAKEFSFEDSAKKQKKSVKQQSLIKKSWSLSLKAGSPKKRYYPEISDPVEVAGVIYVGTQGGVFYAIDSATGDKLWEYAVDAPVATRATVADGRIYFLDLAGRLNALSLTGSLLWQRDLQKAVLNPPLAVGDRLYFLKGDKEIACLSSATGDVLWTQALPTFVKRLTVRGQATLVADAGQLLAALGDGQLYGLDMNSGQVKWSKNFAPPLKTFKDIDADLVADADAYYVAGYFEQVQKVAKSTKATLWTLEVGAGVSPLLWQDKILVADLHGDLNLYSKTDGLLTWKTELAGSVLSSPVLFADHFFVTTHAGEVLVVEPSTGDVVQKLAIAGGAITKPLVIQDRVVVLSGSGVLTAFVPK